MLTDAEKKWLEEREEVELQEGYYFCAHCPWRNAQWSPWTGWCDADCVMTRDNFRDAAEFEARVAVKALTRFDTCNDCAGLCFGDCSWDEPSCEATRLKHARLAVEEEMEG